MHHFLLQTECSFLWACSALHALVHNACRVLSSRTFELHYLSPAGMTVLKVPGCPISQALLFTQTSEKHWKLPSILFLEWLLPSCLYKMLSPGSFLCLSNRTFSFCCCDVHIVLSHKNFEESKAAHAHIHTHSPCAPAVGSKFQKTTAALFFGDFRGSYS